MTDQIDDLDQDNDVQQDDRADDPAYVSLYVHHLSHRIFSAVIPVSWQDALAMYSDLLARGAVQWSSRTARDGQYTIRFSSQVGGGEQSIVPLEVDTELAVEILTLLELSLDEIDTMTSPAYAAHLHALTSLNPDEMKKHFQPLDVGAIVFPRSGLTPSA